MITLIIINDEFYLAFYSKWDFLTDICVLGKFIIDAKQKKYIKSSNFTQLYNSEQNIVSVTNALTMCQNQPL